MIVRMMRMRVGGGGGCEGCCGGLDIGYSLPFLPKIWKCSLLCYFLVRLLCCTIFAADRCSLYRSSWYGVQASCAWHRRDALSVPEIETQRMGCLPVPMVMR
jgi:hypothetical protein